MKITKRTQKVINSCFPKSNSVAVFLIEEYVKSEKMSERVVFAIIKLSNDDIDELKSIIKLAKIDWRDILVLADFANELNAHNNWANTLTSSHKS